MAKNIHVTHHGDGWQVKEEGSPKILAVFGTQEQAVAKAREIAIVNKSELLIHGLDGKIRERNSYGHDPHNIKG